MAGLSPAELTNFVGGLVTDANPMSFPPNASLDEYNMIMKADGTRSRRLGMDIEADGEIISTLGYANSTSDITYKTFKWSNVAGVSDLTYCVVQISGYLGIFDASGDSLSKDGPLFTYDLGDDITQVSFAAVDGILVVAYGKKELLSIEFDPDLNTFSSSTFRLLIRDSFGVEDILDGNNLRFGSYLTKRPKTLTDAHAYNLRNQTFGYPRLSGNYFVEAIEDPLDSMLTYAGSFPSNADSLLDAFFPNSASEMDPVTNRFNPRELTSNPPGTISAPRGFFIIDALDRGTSRIEEINKLYDAKSKLNDRYKTKVLPVDSTPGGASCLAQFAGRMFYSGFSNVTIGGDEFSPHMGAYVLFSKLVESQGDLKVCYQVGDPTSKNFSELLDTDGGFIRLEGAYNIQAMVPLPEGLAVLAENGLWIISGEDRGQFKATSYSTSKLSPNGCDSPGSVVTTGSGFMFWSRDGIYDVAPNQFGDLEVSNISKGVIQKLYDTISEQDKRYTIGILDKYDRQIKWIYGNRLSSETECRELVYSMDFKAFTLNKINRAVKSPEDEVTYDSLVVAAPVTLPAFSAIRDLFDVYVGTDLVMSNTDPVVITGYEIVDALKETKYLTIVKYSTGDIRFTFSHYNNDLHYDWTVLSGTGIDADSKMLTGWNGGGDFQRNKQVPFLMMHFYKTEDGFSSTSTEIIDGENVTDFTISNQSSCIVQAQWNWANHINSGKWGSEFQAYRLTKRWFPSSIADGYDNGFYTVETRNKLRGSGKVLSLLMKSEPGKHMDIIGWSMMLQGNSSV